MPLGSGHFTPTTHNVYRPDIWSPRVNRAFEKKHVMGKICLNLSDTLATNGGKSIIIPNLSNLVANQKVVGQQVTLQAPTETAVTLQINNHYESSILIEKFLAETVGYDLKALYAEKLGYAVANKFDETLTGLYAAVPGTNVIGNQTTPISDALIRQAIRILEADNDVPYDEMCFVFHPALKEQLYDIPKYYDAASFGIAPTSEGAGLVASGTMRTLYGIPVYFSPNVVKAAVGGGNAYHNFLLHKEAFAYAIAPGSGSYDNVNLESSYIQEYLGTLVTADMIWGVAVTRPTAVVVIRTQA